MHFSMFHIPLLGGLLTILKTCVNHPPAVILFEQTLVSSSIILLEDRN